MSDKSKIEWTDATWNPVTGCTKVSRGCENCYAGREAATILTGSPRYAGLATIYHGTPQWLGEVRLQADLLDQPLHWRKGRRIFVCSQADLFHDQVPGRFIWDVMVMMIHAAQHNFQVLTKRPARMKDWMEGWGEIHSSIGKLPAVPSNVWLGVSVEDQKTADERIPLLLQTPAAVRFVSYEPALAPVEFTRLAHPKYKFIDGLRGVEGDGYPANYATRRLDWIIAGGESGANARPSHPDWFRAIQKQCQAAGVPFFFKQWGEWLASGQSAPFNLNVTDEKRYHYWEDGARSVWVGKKLAGRLLDGRTWDDFPEPQGSISKCLT